MDDISWDMNYERFSAIRDILTENKVSPIIGVIPENGDPHLKEMVGAHRLTPEEFWDEMRMLHREHGWDIALHGYDHVYCTGDGGLLGRNPCAEFAGLPYEAQYEKIGKGLAVLRAQGLEPCAFMAPSHSFDLETLRALDAQGMRCITDGEAGYPYRMHGILMIPQIRSWPDMRGIGIDTICYHTNGMDEAAIRKFGDFIRNYRERILCFRDVAEQAQAHIPLKWRLLNPVTRAALRARGVMRRLKYGQG